MTATEQADLFLRCLLSGMPADAAGEFVQAEVEAEAYRRVAPRGRVPKPMHEGGRTGSGHDLS